MFLLDYLLIYNVRADRTLVRSAPVVITLSVIKKRRFVWFPPKKEVLAQMHHE